MDFAVTGVDHEPFVVGLVDQFFQQRLPDALVAPTNEATVGIAPPAIVWRQIPPGCSGAQDPENGVEKKPVVSGSATPQPLLSGQMRLEELPGFVVEVVAAVSMSGYGGSLDEVCPLFSFFRESSIS